MSWLTGALPPQPKSRQPLHFFDLPWELRFEIPRLALVTDQIIDLKPRNHRTARHHIDVFLTSHRVHNEAYPVYYGGHTFRIFPTRHRFFGHEVRPLVARLPTRYCAALVSLELRLGPGWRNPPRSWRVDDGLGLEEMEAVRTVKVIVECDPSYDIFNIFNTFTGFAGSLFEGVLQRLPSVIQVELEGWPSVTREDRLVKRLLEAATNAGVRVSED